jgi:molybdate transport system ATP-binding protein
MNGDVLSDYLVVNFQQDGPIPMNIHFSCNQHEMIVFVGPSGSGKTTILRSIAGLYHPKIQFVRCHNKIWSNHEKNYHLPAQKRQIGLVFQQYALFPHLTIALNIELACGNVPSMQRSVRVKEMLRLVNLDGLDNRYPAQLSGGQQQRVALARALARNPEILLLDEPFSAVDQVTRRKLRNELANLRKKLNIPIILVTHDLDEARMLADRICILHNGNILQTGIPEQLLVKPETAEVARLIDLNNIFSAEIIRHDQKKQFTILNWKNMQLECRINESFAPGSKVDWVIPPESVILHRQDRPSRGEHENPVPGIVAHAITLGENTSVTMYINGHDKTLSFTIPTHVARRNNIYDGKTISVSLLANAIHMMPRPES